MRTVTTLCIGDDDRRSTSFEGCRFPDTRDDATGKLPCSGDRTGYCQILNRGTVGAAEESRLVGCCVVGNSHLVTLTVEGAVVGLTFHTNHLAVSSEVDVGCQHSIDTILTCRIDQIRKLSQILGCANLIDTVGVLLQCPCVASRPQCEDEKRKKSNRSFHVVIILIC